MVGKIQVNMSFRDHYTAERDLKKKKKKVFLTSGGLEPLEACI